MLTSRLYHPVSVAKLPNFCQTASEVDQSEITNNQRPVGEAQVGGLVKRTVNRYFSVVSFHKLVQ